MGAACLLHNKLRRNLHDLHNKDIDHLVNDTAICEISMVFRTGGTMGICLCATTGI